jgi:hypothetical protein
MMRIALALLLVVLCAARVVAADELPIGRFSQTGLEGWQPKHFKGTTDYRLVEEGGERVLYAYSENAASGLIYPVDYDPRVYPILKWRWKIGNTIAAGDSRTRDGDDYAARIYVVFPHWFFPMTRTINYIWANRLPKGESQLSVFTSNDMMIAVESGAERVGEWVEVERNLLEDYRTAFGEEPPAVGAVAIMTDTDGTGERATAWYGDIQAIRRD